MLAVLVVQRHTKRVRISFQLGTNCKYNWKIYGVTHIIKVLVLIHRHRVELLSLAQGRYEPCTLTHR